MITYHDSFHLPRLLDHISIEPKYAKLLTTSFIPIDTSRDTIVSVFPAQVGHRKHILLDLYADS